VNNPEFLERLYPSKGTIVALMLSSPMVLLAALPFDGLLAAVLAVIVPSSLVGLAFYLSPKIELQGGILKVGKMTIPQNALGKAEFLEGEKAQFERGPGLSPGSQRLFRGDISPVVKIMIIDPEDPTEYLLFSSRKGQALVSALGANRT
jgi:hypothetical protein